MVEEIVHVSAKLKSEAFGGAEILVNAEIQAPSAGSPQHVPLGDLWIAEDIGADWRRTEGGRIKDLIASVLVEVTAQHNGTIRRLGVEVAHGVYRGDANVTWLNGITVIADPERRETSSRFCEH